MKIAFIGLGSIAQKHIKAIKKIDSKANLFAVRSKKNSPLFNGIENISFVNLASFDLDAIIISNPSVYHKQYIIDLAPLGIPIMVEKPICISIDQWIELNQLAKNPHPIIYCAFNLRFHPLIQFLKSYLKEKPDKIYEVNSYCGSYLPLWRPQIDYKNSYSAKSDLGGGVQFDLIHEIDYINFIFGQPIETQKQYRKLSHLKIDSFDYAHFNLTYQNFSVSITLNYFRKDPKRTLEIVRENDTLLLNFIDDKLVNLNTGRVLIDAKNKGMELSYLNQMKYFISIIKKKQQTNNSFKESLRIIKPIL